MPMSKVTCNLSALRKQRHLRQTDLSKMTGISQKALSELETGKSKGVSFSTLTKLCDALNVTVDQLFELRPDESQTQAMITLIEKPSCSFCGTNEADVDLLVVGKANSKAPVYICSDCIERCNKLLLADRASRAAHRNR